MFDEAVCPSVGRCGIRWTISLLFCLDAEGINGEILANFFMDDTNAMLNVVTPCGSESFQPR